MYDGCLRRMMKTHLIYASYGVGYARCFPRVGSCDEGNDSPLARMNAIKKGIRYELMQESKISLQYIDID
jgi:hypothetical protein